MSPEISSQYSSFWAMSHGCFASACTSAPAHSRWTGSKRNARSRPLHSFRFFGLVFILPGVVGPNLPADFAVFAAYWDLATGVLAMLALLTVQDSSAVLAVRRRLQSRGDGRPDPRLLPRRPCRPSCAGGAIGCRICDPGHLRARADDHACRRVLFADAPSAEGRLDPRWRSDRVLDSACGLRYQVR